MRCACSPAILRQARALPSLLGQLVAPCRLYSTTKIMIPSSFGGKSPPIHLLHGMRPLGSLQVCKAAWPASASVAASSSDGRDSYNRLSFTGWYTAGTTWTRAAILLREGILVVLDTVVAHEQAVQEGWVAGPVWHLVVPEKPTRGRSHASSWYDAKGFWTLSHNGQATSPTQSNHSRMLVVLADGDNATHGLASKMLWGKIKPWSVFAKRSALRPSEPVHFLSILAPHSDKKPASILAEAIAVNASSPNGSYEVCFRDSAASVTIDAKGDWAVRRDQACA